MRQAGTGGFAPAQATTSFAVAKAAQQIVMPAEQAVYYGRNKLRSLTVSSTSGLAVSLALDTSTNNYLGCRVEGTALRLLDRLTGGGGWNLINFCTIVASVAESENYLAATPASSKVMIGFPQWNVEIANPGALKAGTTVSVTVTESSGNAFYVTISTSDTTVCEIAGGDQTQRAPNPGQTTYRTTMTIKAGAAGKKCDVVAQAGDTDYGGGKASDRKSFAVT